MSQMTRRPSGGAVALPSAEDVYALPRDLAAAAETAMDPVIGRGHSGRDDPGLYIPPRPVSRKDWQAAQDAAARLDVLLADCVTQGLLSDWLLPINLGSRNPQSPQEFPSRVMALAMLLGDLPAAAFTVQAMRQMPSGFFPSHHDIRSVIQPIADRWDRQRKGLRRLRCVEDPPPEPEAPRRGGPRPLGALLPTGLKGGGR